MMIVHTVCRLFWGWGWGWGGDFDGRAGDEREKVHVKQTVEIETKEEEEEGEISGVSFCREKSSYLDHLPHWDLVVPRLSPVLVEYLFSCFSFFPFLFFFSQFTFFYTKLLGNNKDIF